jgi:hypothetical protein
MRKPFQVTPEMANELEDEISKYAPQGQPRLPLLMTREHTHGSFHDNAALSQTLKGCFRTLAQWNRMEPEQRESIDLMCTKLARIMTGDPLVKDHWDDIGGYAQLAAEICKQ